MCIIFDDLIWLGSCAFIKLIKWVPSSVKSPATPMFVQPFVYAYIRKASKLGVNSHCEGNPPVTGVLPSQRASNAENIPVLWRNDLGSRTYLYREPFGYIVKNSCPWVLCHWYSGGQLTHRQPRGCWGCRFYIQLTDWISVSNIPLKMGLDFVPHSISREVTLYTCMKARVSNGFPTWVNVIW